MCGIGGIVRLPDGQRSISEDMISMLLVGNEHRGVDATGIALSQEDGTVDVWKCDEPAWKAVTSEPYYQFIKDKLKDNTWAALCHTRAATQGNPRDNNNNHPMFAGKAAVIHNGGIHNEQQIFAKYGLKPEAETDSDVLRAIADRWGLTADTAKVMGELVGTIAGAIIHPDYPKRLFLMRSGSPMTLAATDDFFLWASEKNTLHGALRPTEKRFGLYFQTNKVFAGFCPMPDHTIWEFDKDGHKKHYEFNAFYGVYVDPKRRTYDGYKERQEAWTRAAGYKAKDETEKLEGVTSPTPQFKPAWCGQCDQEWLIPSNDYEHKYTCDKSNGGCGRFLQPMPAGKK